MSTVSPSPALAVGDGYAALLLAVGPPPWFEWDWHTWTEHVDGTVTSNDAAKREVINAYVADLSNAIRAVVIDCPDVTRRGFYRWCRSQVYGGNYR